MTEQILSMEDTNDTSHKMTYEDYLRLPEDGRLVEWVNEEAIYHMPVKPIHQEIVIFLTTLLATFSNFFGRGKVLSAPVELRCHPNGNSREPDIMFIRSENLEHISENRMEGAPDLIIEVVSNESVARDYDDKFIEYQECGVSEYWIIDPRPRRKRALFYQLGDDGEYIPVTPVGGIYTSRAVPGFWFKVAWLWEQPDPLLTALEIAGFGEQAEILRQKKQSSG